MTTLDDYLQYICDQEGTVHKDQWEDHYDAWLADLDGNDIMQHAEDYIKIIDEIYQAKIKEAVKILGYEKL